MMRPVRSTQLSPSCGTVLYDTLFRHLFSDSLALSDEESRPIIWGTLDLRFCLDFFRRARSPDGNVDLSGPGSLRRSQ